MAETIKDDKNSRRAISMTAPTDAGMVELIERLEKATGGAREIDRAIYWAVNRNAAKVAYWNGATGLPRDIDTMTSPLGRAAVEHAAPCYTSSIDAALTLVPEGWRIYSIQDQRHFQAPAGFFVGIDEIGGARAVSGRNLTIALALCIAALRTRSPA